MTMARTALSEMCSAAAPPTAIPALSTTVTDAGRCSAFLKLAPMSGLMPMLLRISSVTVRVVPQGAGKPKVVLVRAPAIVDGAALIWRGVCQEGSVECCRRDGVFGCSWGCGWRPVRRGRFRLICEGWLPHDGVCAAPGPLPSRKFLVLRR